MAPRARNIGLRGRALPGVGWQQERHGEHQQRHCGQREEQVLEVATVAVHGRHLRYVASFGASALAVPLVAAMHRYSSDFKYLFFALSAMAALMFAAAVLLPSRTGQRAPA